VPRTAPPSRISAVQARNSRAWCLKLRPEARAHLVARPAGELVAVVVSGTHRNDAALPELALAVQVTEVEVVDLRRTALLVRHLQSPGNPESAYNAAEPARGILILGLRPGDAGDRATHQRQLPRKAVAASPLRTQNSPHT
jgi:hypothetical protein